MEQSATETKSLKLPSKAHTRLWLTRLVISYLVILVLWLLTLELWAGRNWVLSIALFMPPQCWLVPVLVLLPVCLLVYRRLCWLLCAAIVIVFLGYMNWSWQVSVPSQTPDLTLLSNNIAQRSLDDLWEFVDKENPDVMAFQDVGRFALQAHERFPNRNVSIGREFILVSRFPIVSATPIPGMFYRDEPVAYRYELVCGRKSIAIYNVHMPTPRYFFLGLHGDGLVKSIPKGTGIYSKEAWEDYSEYWAHRVELTQTLLTTLEKEKLPFLLAGDFNMPDHGTLYHRFSSRFTDVFHSVGRGYGLSFPGNVKTIIAFNRPWMRIDYQFAQRNRWHPLSCRIERLTSAKHQALVGRYRLRFDIAPPKVSI